MFKLGGVDTSPSYLLFQTLLPLFWTLISMIWIKLTQTDTVFSRIAMVLFLCRNKSSRIDLKIYRELFLEYIKNIGERINQRGPPIGHKPWGGGRALQACGPLGPPPTLIPTLYIHIQREKIREKDSSRFTIRSRRRLLFFIGRADLESVLGSREGDSSPSSSPTFLHHQFHDAHRCAWVIPS